MNTTTQQAESATSNPLDSADHTYLDDASSGLGVALTFLDAADNFMDEIRHWVKPSGYEAKHHLFLEVLKAQTMVAASISVIGRQRLRFGYQCRH